jgi:hypothetical protein
MIHVLILLSFSYIFLSLSQFICCCFGNVGGAITRNILLFNVIRGGSFLFTSCSFLMFPSNECWIFFELLLIMEKKQKKNVKLSNPVNNLIDNPTDNHASNSSSKEVQSMKEEESVPNKRTRKNECFSTRTIVRYVSFVFINMFQFNFFVKSSSRLNDDNMYLQDRATNKGLIQWSYVSDLLSRCSFYTYVLVAIYVTFEHGSSSSPSSSSSSSIYFDIGRHSLSYGITYHFIFITFGYSLRGVRNGIRGYISMAKNITFGFGLCSLSVALRLATIPDEQIFGMLIFLLASIINMLLSLSLLKTKPLKQTVVTPAFII